MSTLYNTASLISLSAHINAGDSTRERFFSRDVKEAISLFGRDDEWGGWGIGDQSDSALLANGHISPPIVVIEET